MSNGMSMAIALALMPLYFYLVVTLPSRYLKRHMADGWLKELLFKERGR